MSLSQTIGFSLMLQILLVKIITIPINLLCMLNRFSHVQLFAILWTVAHQTLSSVGSPSKNTGVGCHCPPPGGCPDPEIKPVSHVSCTRRHVPHHQHLLWKPINLLGFSFCSPCCFILKSIQPVGLPYI